MTDEKFKELQKRVLHDGEISKEDVDQMHEFFLATGMDKTKADWLFMIKNEFNQEHIDNSFNKLFIDHITYYLLNDEETPGLISEKEATWLIAKKKQGGRKDDVIEELMKTLRDRSINYPDMLDEKKTKFKCFYSGIEKCLNFSQILSSIAIVMSMVLALVLFVAGCILPSKYLIRSFQKDPVAEGHSELLEEVVTSVDYFLFGLALIILANGIYRLFIKKKDLPSISLEAELPKWRRVSDFDELKSILSKVILMALLVLFFEYSLRITPQNPIDLLAFASSILLVAIAIFVAHKKHDK